MSDLFLVAAGYYQRKARKYKKEAEEATSKLVVRESKLYEVMSQLPAKGNILQQATLPGALTIDGDILEQATLPGAYTIKGSIESAETES